VANVSIGGAFLIIQLGLFFMEKIFVSHHLLKKMASALFASIFGTS
jgi:hypothetical protein